MKKILLYLLALMLFVRCSDGGHDRPLQQNQETPVKAINKKEEHLQLIVKNTGNPSLKQAPRSTKSSPSARVKRTQVQRCEVQLQSVRMTDDSVRIKRISELREVNLPVDLNEPVSRKNLSGKIDNPGFYSMVTLSDETFLELSFDNDILDYTDRFYTNGIRVELTAPGLRSNPLSIAMVPYWSSAVNYYGIAIVQNMYTPSTTKTGGIKIGDRPYAAYLYFASKKTSNDPVHRFRQISELDIGIIGPNSYGEWVQRAFHNSVPTNNEPLGWEYQIQNDLVLNYSMTYEKGILSNKHFEMNLLSTGQIGTLYTNFTGGIGLRAGWFNPYFTYPGVEKRRILKDKGLRTNQLFFILKGSGKVVGYDATLQGGLFNKSSAYVIPVKDVSRVVFQTSVGVTATLGGFRFDVEQVLLSPEFSGGLWHKWVHMSLFFWL